MGRSLYFLDLDLGARVIDWGSLEEIQEVLLSKAQLFTGQVSCVLANPDKALSTGYSKSLIYNRRVEGFAVSIVLDGVTVFDGILKDIVEDAQGRTATFIMENALSRPSESPVDQNMSGVNPAIACLEIFRAAGVEDDQLASGTFLAAAGPSLAAGATINLAMAGSSTSTLDAVQQISELAGLSIAVHGGVIRAHAFKPYAGSGAGLRQPLTGVNVRTFLSKSRAWQNFNNAVVVKYGAALELKIEAPLGELEKPFIFETATGAELVVPDLVSAQFFGRNYLDRAGFIRDLIDLELDAVRLPDATIGYRYPVTASQWGLDAAAFEVVETHRAITSKSLTLKLASLS